MKLLCASAVNNNYIIMQMMNIDITTNYTTGRRGRSSVCVCMCVYVECVCVCECVCCGVSVCVCLSMSSLD